MEEVAIRYPAQSADALRHTLAEGVLILDEQGVIRYADQSAESFLGYGAGQLTNVSFSGLWASRSPVPLSTVDKPRAFEGELTRRNGEIIPASVTVAPLSAAGDDSWHLVTINSAAELERVNKALLHAQRLAGIGTLSASVAHELTNPISIITSTCTNLRYELEDGDLSPAQLARYVDMIEQSAYRCARIVEVLRSYTHNDGQNVAVTSPQAIVRDALTLVEQQFRKQANVSVETEIDEDLRSIVCDHNRITQVVVNLLLNARDAMQPAGGVVRVRFWLLDPSIDYPGLLRSPADAAAPLDYFAFSVADTGHGIDAAVMERIFEPFFTTKPNGQGTGLGLYIAQGIVAQHDGRIWAENRPQGGATFTVVLPRRQ